MIIVYYRYMHMAVPDSC